MTGVDDRPALVVDVRTPALDADRRASASGEPQRASPADVELVEDEAIDVIAVLHDGSDAPLLLPIAPTRDRAWLDAVARILRFAVLRGERMPTVATAYGGALERRLAFGRRLPAWAYEGIDDTALRRAPPALRRVLAPSDRGWADRG